MAFSIPFPLDSDVDVVMGNPLFRSASSDNLAAVANPALYTPPEDLSKLIGHAPLGELPALVESAPRVIHAERRQRPEGAPAGFFLHSPDKDIILLSSSAPCRSGMYRSVYSGDSDAPKRRSKGIYMTSFAERKKKLPESPGVQVEERPPSPSEVESQEIGALLEEKRKSIEAQKRRIEAIFAKHRQRVGKNAFLQLQREQGEGGCGTKEEADPSSLEERLTHMEEELFQEEETEKQDEEKGKEVQVPPKLEKQVTFSVEPKERPLMEYNEVVSKLSSTLQALQKDMQRLTEQQQQLMGRKSAPSSAKNTPTKIAPASPSKSWMIPTSSKLSSTPPRMSRESTRVLSPSGSPSNSNAPKSPKTKKATIPRMTSELSKSPKRQHLTRPSELGFQPLTRVLSPLQSVDTLPHLRRVSPSQCRVQTSSSFRIGGPRTPPEPVTHPREGTESESGSLSSDEHATLFNLELEPPEPPQSESVFGGGGSSGAASECSFFSDMLVSVSQRHDEGETDQEQLDVFSSDSMSDHTETESKAGVSFYLKVPTNLTFRSSLI